MLKKLNYRLMNSLVLALAAALFTAGMALAGGVVVTLDGAPPDVPPGTPFEVGFKILSAHDGSAQGGFDPIVTLTNLATGETVKVTAKSDGEDGHYTAQISLPSAGQWNWEIQPFGFYADNYPASVMAPFQVSEAAAVSSADGSQPAFSQAPAVQGIGQNPVATLLLAGSGFALLAALAIRYMPRRRATQ